MRKTVLCLLISVCALLAGCTQAKPTVSMYDLQKAMLAAGETLPEMTSVNGSSEDSDNLFSYLSDMDYENVENYFLAYSKDGLADEIAVIAVYDESNISEAESSLKAHLESRRNLYTQYDPSQLTRTENAKVFTSGRYAVLIICDNADKVKTAFETFIEEN